MGKSARAGGSVVAVAAAIAMLMPFEVSAEGIAKRLSCTFDRGTSTTYEAGEFTSDPA